MAKSSTRAFTEELKERLQRGEEAEAILDRLLDWAVSNRSLLGKSTIDGRECRYVNCHTYHGNAFPKVLIDALRFMGEPVSRLKRAKEGQRD